MVDGLRIHTRLARIAPASDMPPIVLVHGLSVSSRYMVPVGERLAPFLPVYAPDLPGFGKSQAPRAILDVPALANALAHWMDTYRIQTATLLGNSLGCQIAVELAVRRPERVAGLVLTGPTMDPAGRTMLEQARRLAVVVTREPLASIVTQTRDYLACGLRRTIGTLRHGLRDRIEAKLPYVRVPTLVVRGERDAITPQRWAEQVTRLLPDGRLLVIPGAPHAVNYDTPRVLTQAVLAFLTESYQMSAIS